MNSQKWFVALAIMATIVFLSLCRSMGVWADEIYRVQEFLGGDKAAHFLMGAGVMVSALLAFTVPRLRWSPSVVLCGVLMLLALDELSQAWLPGRDFSLLDWLTGALGAIAVSAVHYTWRKWSTV